MRSNGRASEYSTAYAMCLLLMQLRSMINLKAYLVTSNLKERSRHSLGIAMKCPISCRHSTKSPSKGSRTNSNSTLGGVVRSSSVHREYIRMSHLEYTRIISASIVLMGLIEGFSPHKDFRVYHILKVANDIGIDTNNTISSMYSSRK
jgi:hypothetical protein